MHCPIRRQVPPVLKSIFIFWTLTPRVQPFSNPILWHWPSMHQIMIIILKEIFGIGPRAFSILKLFLCAELDCR